MKLVVLPGREGLNLAASRAGLILAHLKRTGQLKEPLRRTSARRRQWKRQYATPKPKSHKVQAPRLDCRAHRQLQRHPSQGGTVTPVPDQYNLLALQCGNAIIPEMDELVRPVFYVLAQRMVADIESAILERASQLAEEEPDFQLSLAWRLWDAVHEREDLMRAEWKRLEVEEQDRERVLREGHSDEYETSRTREEQLRKVLLEWLRRTETV